MLRSGPGYAACEHPGSGADSHQRTDSLQLTAEIGAVRLKSWTDELFKLFEIRAKRNNEEGSKGCVSPNALTNDIMKYFMSSKANDIHLEEYRIFQPRQ